MGFLDKLFKGNDSELANQDSPALVWKQLNATSQIQQIVADSNKTPQLIFKHSTRCGISRMVLKNFESNYDFSQQQVQSNFLDLLSYRNVSQQVAKELGVHHESPQLILLKNGEVIYTESHHGIDVKRVKELLN